MFTLHIELSSNNNNHYNNHNYLLFYVHIYIFHFSVPPHTFVLMIYHKVAWKKNLDGSKVAGVTCNLFGQCESGNFGGTLLVLVAVSYALWCLQEINTSAKFSTLNTDPLIKNKLPTYIIRTFIRHTYGSRLSANFIPLMLIPQGPSVTTGSL